MSAIPSDAQGVLDFWFGAPGSPGHGQLNAAWFRKSPSFDAEIARRFAPLVDSALGGGLRDWAQQPASALARIVLLDQFTRSVFRDTPRAFAGDALALAAAREMVSARRDDALPPLQRAFVYMPFEHAEDLTAQDEALRLFGQLAVGASDAAGFLDYARRHRAVIARFGRFPHRNAVLGRTSTPDEIEFLKQPGSHF